jgi:hypothetical protein
MILKILTPFYKFKIALLHATYHRMMKKADKARVEQDILKFKKYIYKSEDAWRKLVILTHKLKPNG